ncbi:MAG: hypothetical protein KGM24_08380 [Elusimicrobia bacterium]|nr:hypothetical protein [Elusimicrobiota bacterium]
MPHHALLAVAAVAALLLLLRLKDALAGLAANRRLLVKVGRDALDRQPDSIALVKRADGFPLSADARALAEPLIALGFSDCGVHSVDKLPGVLIQVLVQPEARVAAFVYEHARAGRWLELEARLEGGRSVSAVNRAPTGQPAPPFVLRAASDPSASPEELYRRLRAALPPSGVVPVDAASVVAQYEEAYRAIVRWRKAEGLRAAQVAAAARAEAKRRSGA